MSGESIRVSLMLQDLAHGIDNALESVAGERIPFVLILQVDKIAQYISNTDRKDGVELLESLLTRWKATRAGIPARTRFRATPRMKNSLSWWEDVVSRSAKGLTPEQITAAAQICLDTGCCAWHGAAFVTGEKCRCVPCMRARGEE